jgi:HAD superfamily hydrolase (TIGR01490 family)
VRSTSPAIQRLAQPCLVDPPHRMLATVHQGYRDLLGISFGQGRVVEDAAFGPRDAQFFANPCDNNPRLVAEMTPRLAEEKHARGAYPAHKSLHPRRRPSHPSDRAALRFACMPFRRLRGPDQFTASSEAVAVAAEAAAGVDVLASSRAAAFFDLDNTVLRGAAIFYFARGMYQRKYFRARDIAWFGYQQVRFRLGAEDPEHVDSAQSAALSFIVHRSVGELKDLAEEIFEEVDKKVWPGTRSIAHSHLDEGQRVWLVTAAPVELATIIAKRLGLTGALGTVAEHVDGTYTGRLVGDLLHGPAKAAAVRALAVREGLELERCAAYSDSANDIPMLSLVGYPCAINPDARLRAYAKERGWQIRDYRARRRNTAIGVAAGAGAVAGAIAGFALARRHRR